MRKGFRLFSVALCVCALAACSDDDGLGSRGSGNRGEGVADGYSYVVASSSGELGYLQQVDDISSGLLDATKNDHNRLTVEGNMDFVSVGGYLVNMNYASKSSDGISTLSYSYEVADGALARRSPMELEGDVKARGTFGDRYLVGASSQDDTDADCYYERMKIVDVQTQRVINNNGRITIDKQSPEYRAVGEFVQFSDMAQFGDYMLVSYTTKQETPSEDAANQTTRKPSTTTTRLAKNTYVGVYKFDPSDSGKQYLKFAGLLKAEAGNGVEYGQIRGNSSSRTEPASNRSTTAAPSTTSVRAEARTGASRRSHPPCCSVRRAQTYRTACPKPSTITASTCSARPAATTCGASTIWVARSSAYNCSPRKG